MAYILAIANQNGGVGKTTTAINLSAALAHSGASVLLIDLDPQANATSGLGVPKEGLVHTANDLFQEGSRPLELAVESRHPLLRIVPANSDLIGIETRLDDLNKHFFLRDSLEDLIAQPVPVRPPSTSGSHATGENTDSKAESRDQRPEGSVSESSPTPGETGTSESSGTPVATAGRDEAHSESSDPHGTQAEADKSAEMSHDARSSTPSLRPEESDSREEGHSGTGHAAEAKPAAGLSATRGEIPGVAPVEGAAEDPGPWIPHYVILDCPPTLNVITTNALVASDSLLIPVQAEFYALEGLTELLRTFTAVRKRFSPGLMIEGMLLTMYDSRTRLAGEVESELRKHYGERVFRSVIPRSVRFGEAPSHGMTILEYDPAGRGAEAYLSLAKEVTANDTKRAWSRSLVAAAGRRPGHVPQPAVPGGRGLTEDFLRRD